MTHVEALHAQFDDAMNGLDTQYEYRWMKHREYADGVKALTVWLADQLPTAEELDAQDAEEAAEAKAW